MITIQNFTLNRDMSIAFFLDSYQKRESTGNVSKGEIRSRFLLSSP